MEPGESGAACAVRECREELGIEIRLSGELGEASYRYPEREVSLCFFEGTVERGEPRAQVHSELRWAAPEELGGYGFCPADEALVAALSKRKGPQPE